MPRWLGAPEPGQKFDDFLRELDENFALQFAMAWEQCREDLLPIELSVSQAPARLYHDGQQLLFSYRPLLKDDGRLAGLLVVIADVSADVERQRLELEQKETLGMLDRVVNDRHGFVEFFSEGSELVRTIGSATESELVLQKRALHTLKGNCLVCGMHTVAGVCHELETELAESGGVLKEDQKARLNECWQSLRGRSNKLLGERGQLHIEIESAQFDQLLRAVLEARPHGEIAMLVAQLKLEPVAARLSRVAGQARRLASRLNKEGVEVEVDDGMLRLDPRAWGAFWSAFVHVVRNAVDHGLETADIRGKIGKAGSGRLQLRSRVEADEFVITLSDDGRGIDWERVRERALELGLSHATDADLKQALFADGLSTAETVTEFSGRGVGLSAVRAACEARGGHIDVESSPGQGTTFSFRFPRATITVKPEDLLRPSSYRPRARFSSRAPASVELG